jgi:hypothetical protein
LSNTSKILLQNHLLPPTRPTRYFQSNILAKQVSPQPQQQIKPNRPLKIQLKANQPHEAYSVGSALSAA